jgi:hypothetical protein
MFPAVVLSFVAVLFLPGPAVQSTLVAVAGPSLSLYSIGFRRKNNEVKSG